MEIRKNVAPEFVLGTGALNLAGRYAENLSAQKALIVTDPGLIAAGWVSKVTNSLSQSNVESVVFSKVSPNPRDIEVMSGAELLMSSGCDLIVAIGGGSPIDCAKGIGIVATSGENILSFEGVDRIRIPGPPLICIPTTAGTAADISQFAIINDTARKVKIAIISKTMVPDVALIDPRTTTTMSADLTAATGIDALVHAIEAYVSTARSPITDLHALEAVRLVSTNLVQAIKRPDEMSHRDNMMLASVFAGLAFSNAGLGLVHAMAHSLGGLLDLPHGMCNALLLEYVLEFNYSSAPERYASLAKAFGVNVDGLSLSEQRIRFIEALYNLRKAVGLGHGFGELGVKTENIPTLANYALNDPCVATNPVKPRLQDIEQIYERALETR